MESTDKTLNEIIKSIKKMTKGNENTDILQVLLKQKGVGSLVQPTSALLFVANKKVVNVIFNSVQCPDKCLSFFFLLLIKT